MDPARHGYRILLASAGCFTLAAGDFWRYLLTWWGWGAVVALLMGFVVVELVRARIDWRRIPLALLAMIGLMVLSIAWSAYRPETALGAIATIATTVFALFLSLCTSWAELVDALAFALRTVLGLSLVFELVVALVIREPLLPPWTSYSGLDRIPDAFYWSRDLLFEGGRIQGIVGNANILAMDALLSVIAETTRLIAGRGGVASVFWLAVGAATLALTRSSTVFVALVAVGLITLFAWWARRAAGRRRVGVSLLLAVTLTTGVVTAVALRGPLLRLIGRSDDLTHRLDIWATVIDLAAQRPVLGWGWIGYWAPWAEPFRDLVVIRGVTYLQAHDAWLDVFLQLGIVGVVVMGVLVATSAARAWAFALDGPPSAALVPVAILVAILVQGLTESRLLIEIGWALLAVVAIRTAAVRWERR